MKFDCIIANPPYAQIGCDITKNIIKQNPDSNYAMLGTRIMFKPFYKDTLACQFVQIGKYELGSNAKLDWGVEQAILLATNGWTEVIYNRKRKHRQPFQEGVSVGISYLDTVIKLYLAGRSSYMVQMSQGQIPQEAYTRLRNATLVTDKDDQHLRSGYMYVAFETFEEACECAIDIISWTNPTDSHYRCVRWGFVPELRAREHTK